MQNTVFGWIVAGRVHGEKSSYASCGICSENQRQEQQQQLERFWKLEEVESSDEGTNMTIAEQRCVNQFYQNVTRNNQGRFVVKLPFLREPTVLGDSKDTALKRFLSLERKLTRHLHLKEQYVNFMREYEALGHMKEISCNEIGSLHYFLPHHGVTKLDSTTTKLRVVFDASAKTSSNISLNDILSKGPTIQSELFSILIRFRFPRFVFTADIEKMYRQVLLAEEDQCYQLIMWRENPSQPIKYFKLSTVTYGLTPAPFLATKCLEHLANERALTHPLGSEVLKRDFYVDDVMSGSNSLIEAIEMQKQLKEILSAAGFNLRKWCANHPQLLQNIPRGDVEVELNLEDYSEGSIKTLGLTWLPRSDVFRIKTAWEEPKKVTKRTVLSDISHIFDPLGFMSPVTITAKLFIKKLWTLKLDWDASLPMEMHTSWLKFRESLQLLNDIKMPRHIAPSNNPTAIQLHVFSDASEAAYGTAIFVRAKHPDGIITVRLLCAKSKIAPSKTITLPRLELCAAKLAAQLAHRVITDIKLPGMKCYFWTDSEIVLAWLNSESSSYHTFVANRVASIQRLSDPEQWRHVPSKENPADIVSRGMSTEKLSNCNLWLYGPTFLHGSQAIWPAKWTKTNTDLEKRKAATVALAASSIKLPWISEINHSNSFNKLQRIVAYVLRFIHNTRKQKIRQSIFLTAEELEEAVSLILSQVQQEGFKEDLQNLRRSNCVDISSSLSSLAPFVDERGLIRVGGRLENSNLAYNAKHPVLLPYAHQLTKLLMTHIHLSNLHVGPQALLAITRQRFWPIKGKTIARSIVQQCIQCNKAKPKLMTQLMGNLPSTRIQPARPFINSGVDFCGPIQTHFKIRGKQPQKSYIAVYCCFATKAVHLEIASDLTTESFLGTLKRFIARRGHCRRLYCDNATNFVGANNQLKELQSTIYAHNSQQKIVELCQSKGIDFTFIPPRAPHFGGLWEAAVKSAKSLMQRTIASASLTYEELSTVAAEIEAILNSRPITPLSSDPNDLTALTPGHFLIGEPLTTIVEPQSVSQPVSLIKRWKLVSHIKQEFWRRWTNEYLSELQHRHKWKNQGRNAQPGMLVLIKEDNLPPLKWQLGRIIHTIKGDDGLVRVADIKTTSGTTRRPIHKLAPLPLKMEEHPSCDLLSEDSSFANNNNTDPVERTHPRSESHKDPEDTEDQPRSKRTRTSSASLSLLLLTCFILPIMGSSSVQVTPFDSQPGIYFESLGAAHLTSNEWKLIVYYNMDNYWKEFTTINRSINQLQSVCSLLSEGDVCKIFTNQFNRLRQEIVSNNELLSPTSTSRRTRLRRAPLNIIGNIASSLFGVLDSEYAERLSITINSIKGNEDHLLQLIKNQTSLIDSTTNILRREEEAFQTQLRDVDGRINQIIDHINNFTERLHQQKMTELFSALTLEVILMSSNYQRAQAAIIDVLVDTHHGKINPLLLTPTQLKQELTTIKEHLPSTLRLPARQNDILQLYHLMKVEGRATSNHIIFQIKLPLFALEEFEIFHIIPVPVLVNQSFVAIKPTADFMIINLHRDQYYPLTEEEFKACVTIGETNHMCTQRHPVYRKGANISACELGFIANSAPSTSCEVVNAEKFPKWVQLFNPNQWIYSVEKPTILTIVCGSTMSQLRVTGAGILKIQERCEIKQEFLTLHSHNIYPKITNSSFVPTENLTDFITPERLAPIKHSSHQYANHLQELKVLREQIQEIHQAEKLPNQINPTSIHQLTLGYAALILGIILSVAFGYVRWKTHKRNSTMKVPIPKPRTSVGPQFTINIDENEG